MALIVKCNNGIVTDEYMKLIGSALHDAGFSTQYTSDFSDALKQPKDEIIVVARTVEAFKLVLKGYKRVIVWFQGIEPEESYMTHKSKIRYVILSSMEKYILKKGLYFIFVSKEMLRHYEEKYKISLNKDNYYILFFYLHLLQMNYHIFCISTKLFY